MTQEQNSKTVIRKRHLSGCESGDFGPCRCDELSLNSRQDTASSNVGAINGAWLPIESAPKDGTELLGLFGPKRAGLIWWFAPSSQTFGWCNAYGRRVRPTHWIPWPRTAPTSGDRSGEQRVESPIES